MAISCCCNISLGNNKACSAICKYAGPYLVAQLDSWNNSLLVIKNKNKENNYKLSNKNDTIK